MLQEYTLFSVLVVVTVEVPGVMSVEPSLHSSSEELAQFLRIDFFETLS